jgi:hypothetical protein
MERANRKESGAVLTAEVQVGGGCAKVSPPRILQVVIPLLLIIDELICRGLIFEDAERYEYWISM